MPGDFFDIQPRPFTAMSLAGLSKEAEEQANAALAAMSDWRNGLAALNAKSGKAAIERMAAAAQTLGWPAQVVDAARTQLQSVAEFQTRSMDQLIDAWEQQIKQPSASPSAILSKLQSLAGGWPGAGDRMPTNPFEFWMQSAQQWQKIWTDAMGAATKTR